MGTKPEGMSRELSRSVSRRALLRFGAGAGITVAALLTACGQASTPASPTTGAAAAKPTAGAASSPAATAASQTAAPTAAPQAKPTAQAASQSSGAKTAVRFIAMDYDARMEPDTQKLIQEFNASQSKIDASVQIVKWSEGKTVLLTQIDAGQPPDIANYSGGGLLEFVSSNVIEPLDNHLGTTFLDNFVKASLDAMRVSGKLMGLPYFLDPRGLFYRSDLFKKAGLNPPVTWDDVRQAAKKLHDPPNVYGIGIGVSGPSGGNDDWWYAWVGSIGAGSDLSRWGSDKRSLVGSDHGIAAVQFLVDLARTGKVTQPNPINAGRDEDLQPLFLSGKLAMLETGSWFPTIIQQSAPSLQFDVAPLPVAKSGMKSADVFWPDAVMMFQQSKHKDEATELLKFMFSAKNRLLFAKQRGVVPARKDVGSDPSYAVTKFDKFFVEQLQTAYNVFETPWPASGTQDDKTIQNGLAQAILGEKSVKDAMQATAAALDKSHGL